MAAVVLGGLSSTLGIVLFSKLVQKRPHNDDASSSSPSLSPLLSYSADTPDLKQPWVSNHRAQGILTYLHIAYPLVLLVWFIVVFTLRSIATSRTEEEDVETDPSTPTQVGPGGKPLPKISPSRSDGKQDVLDFSKPRKLLFEWLSLGAALTFVGNAITVVVHALYARNEDWWCGQAVVVCHPHHHHGNWTKWATVPPGAS